MRFPASLVASGLVALKKKMSAEKPVAGTRKHSEKALEVINGELLDHHRRLGRSDAVQQHQDQEHRPRSSPGDFAGRYIHYGIREHGMAAAMNGMALHGGVIPYGGTFMVFSRLLPPLDPAGGPDGRARDLRDDA